MADANTTSIGRIPRRSRFIRRATIQEVVETPECIALFVTDDGKQIWLPRDQMRD